MGTTIKAKVIYGLKVQKDLFQSEEMEKRTCNHDIDTSLNFCPVCGKPVFTKYQKNILFSLPKCEDSLSDIEGIPDFKYPILASFNEYSDEIIIGLELASLDTDAGDDLSDPFNLTEDLKNEINVDIFKFIDFFNIKVDKENVMVNTYLMMHYH